MTLIDFAPSNINSTTDDTIVHIHCCIDPKYQLCGAYFPDGETGAEKGDCIVCVDLEANDYDHCPKLGRCVK